MGRPLTEIALLFLTVIVALVVTQRLIKHFLSEVAMKLSAMFLVDVVGGLALFGTAWSEAGTACGGWSWTYFASRLLELNLMLAGALVCALGFLSLQRITGPDFAARLRQDAERNGSAYSLVSLGLGLLAIGWAGDVARCQ